MYHYNVTFFANGDAQPRVHRFWAGGVPDAYARCLRRFPGVKLAGAWIEGSFKGPDKITYRGVTHYEPVSTAKIKPQLQPPEEQLVFDFTELINQ